jgi:hypothetical protein
MAMIPKIFHIIWTKDNLPDKYAYIINKWKSTHTDFEIKIYNKNDMQNFVNTVFPQYKVKYDNLPLDIMRIDMVRLLYLYYYGGVYVDIDLLPIKNISPLLKLNELVVCAESELHASFQNKRLLLSNAIIIANKSNEFVKLCIDGINKNSSNLSLNERPFWKFVIEETGPVFITNMYEIYYKKNEITILDYYYFNSFTPFISENYTVPKNINFVYGVHLFDGNWTIQQRISHMEFIKSIETAIVNPIEKIYPLISCILTVKILHKDLQKSINCFKNQTYPKKELIIIYEDIKDKSLMHTNKNFARFINVPNSAKFNLNVIKTEYFCLWDESVHYNPLRLHDQYISMVLAEKNASCLSGYYSINKNTYTCSLSDKDIIKKSHLYKKYHSNDNMHILNKPEMCLVFTNEENQNNRYKLNFIPGISLFNSV